MAADLVLNSIAFILQLVDLEDLEWLRFALLRRLLDLSKNTGLYPSCLLLKGVKVTSIDHVEEGGFGNIWMGQLRGKSVAIKVVGRQHSAEAAIKVLCFRSCYIIWC